MNLVRSKSVAAQMQTMLMSLIKKSFLSFFMVLLLAVPNVTANQISVSSTCVASNQAVRVTTSGNSDPFVFVGIFRSNEVADLNMIPLSALVTWQWTCGTAGQGSLCNPWPTSSTVTFNSLPNGQYIAIRAFSRQPPYRALAASATFQVGGNCGQTPVSAPSPAPVQAPVASPATMRAVIASARADIARLIASNSILAGKFLRLAFHDCVGGCDGTYLLEKVVHCLQDDSFFCHSK